MKILLANQVCYLVWRSVALHRIYKVGGIAMLRHKLKARLTSLNLPLIITMQAQLLHVLSIRKSHQLNRVKIV